MMGATATALVTFRGTYIPYEVIYRVGILRCVPHQPRAQFCTACLAIGHRLDVCPNSNVNRCKICGHTTTDSNSAHHCKPGCPNCGKDHAADDPDCETRKAADQAVRRAAYLKRLRHRQHANPEIHVQGETPPAPTHKVVIVREESQSPERNRNRHKSRHRSPSSSRSRSCSRTGPAVQGPIVRNTSIASVKALSGSPSTTREAKVSQPLDTPPSQGPSSTRTVKSLTKQETLDYRRALMKTKVAPPHPNTQEARALSNTADTPSDSMDTTNTDNPTNSTAETALPAQEVDVDTQSPAPKRARCQATTSQTLEQRLEQFDAMIDAKITAALEEFMTRLMPKIESLIDTIITRKLDALLMPQLEIALQPITAQLDVCSSKLKRYDEAELTRSRRQTSATRTTPYPSPNAIQNE
ncbi:hypothetical protein HPB49_011476 [Dermacentor silvarum]|uniref:Uncharacterized protein n=1 Tax=Dermacentor silvarum TaxID=543639 RepID=A0ACB8C922_DERSI|nr:hypothetical protein HPB49_011476 [Dermacentor silvarum]